MATVSSKSRTKKCSESLVPEDEYEPPVPSKKVKETQVLRRNSPRSARQSAKPKIPDFDPADLDAYGVHKQEQSPFFSKLPMEIRLMVYNELMTRGITSVTWGAPRFPNVIAAVYETGNDDFRADEIDDQGRWRNALDSSHVRICKRMWNEWHEEFIRTQTISYELNLASLFDDYEGVDAETLFVEPLEDTDNLIWSDLRIMLHQLPPKDREENRYNEDWFQFRYQLVFEEELYFSAIERSLEGNTNITRLVIWLNVRVSAEELTRDWQDYWYTSVEADVGFKRLDGVLKALKGLQVLEICRPDFGGINNDWRLGRTATRRFDEAFESLAKRVLRRCDVSSENCNIIGNNWKPAHEGRCFKFKKRLLSTDRTSALPQLQD